MTSEAGQRRHLIVRTQAVLTLLGLASLGYVLLDIFINMEFGCLPVASESMGPQAELSLLPPGVTCRYELGGGPGWLVVGPSMFPTLLFLTCLGCLLVIRRLARRDQSDLAPARYQKPSHAGPYPNQQLSTPRPYGYLPVESSATEDRSGDTTR